MPMSLPYLDTGVTVADYLPSKNSMSHPNLDMGVIVRVSTTHQSP